MIVIKNILHDGSRADILIEGNRFSRISPAGTMEAPGSCGQVMDGSHLAITPAFYNTHTHAAMTLMRGYAEGHDLQDWLENYIWPYEDTLKPQDIRKGSEIAVREMVSSGSVFFNDMYFDIEETISTVAAAGMRAAIGITVMDYHSPEVTAAKKSFIENWQDPTGGRIQLVMAPHAVYTVGPEKLKLAAEYARKHNMRIHIHAAENKAELDNCIKDHGLSPVRYLDSLGVLGPDVILAHCVWVDEAEWDLLAERGVTVAHCPCSNMKLGSGRMVYENAIKSGCRITLGTDGASSNDSLSIIGEMKAAALLAKSMGDAKLLSSEEVFRWATRNGAEAFGIDAGEIAEGRIADAILFNMDDASLQPCHNLTSNIVYSADSRAVSHVICDGKLIW